MAHITSISHVGDKLVVGQVDTSFLTATSRVIPGTAVLNGPVYIGATPQIGVARASCMIGPPLAGLSAPASLEVVGVSNFLGPITNIAGTLNVSAISNFTGSVNVTAVETKNGADLKNAINIGNDTGIFNGPVTMNSALNVTGKIFCGDIDAASIKATFGAFSSVAAPFKQFDIPHPNKSGMRLRHACIEGPEVGVYYRGKLKNKNKIILPEYWDNLVDIETITVNLTPNNAYQELYVKNIEWGKVINIANNLSGPIDCFYTVFAERKDVDKLIVEYEGDNI
jgi:hypothetical protein